MTAEKTKKNAKRTAIFLCIDTPELRTTARHRFLYWQQSGRFSGAVFFQRGFIIIASCGGLLQLEILSPGQDRSHGLSERRPRPGAGAK
jgi:hypothetical protein